MHTDDETFITSSGTQEQWFSYKASVESESMPSEIMAVYT
jgi:hypothetical protein